MIQYFIELKGYSFSVDFWTLGVLLYEINAGFAPFTDESTALQYDKICKGKFQCPPSFTKELSDLINKLIVVDRSGRYMIYDLISLN